MYIYFGIHMWYVDAPECKQKWAKEAETRLLRRVKVKRTDKVKGVSVKFDSTGTMMTTKDFAEFVGKLNGDVTFQIGPADGWDNLNADHVISISPMTFAHELAYIILLEQLYRVHSIQQNLPYTKH